MDWQDLGYLKKMNVRPSFRALSFDLDVRYGIRHYLLISRNIPLHRTFSVASA